MLRKKHVKTNMKQFTLRLKTVIEDIIVNEKDDVLAKLYQGIQLAKNKYPHYYTHYPSHLRKHADEGTNVSTLKDEWRQYVAACAIPNDTIPFMWYMWTDSPDTNALHDVTPTDTHPARINQHVLNNNTTTSSGVYGNVEELHVSNHRMYMIAKKYKRNIKQLKSKYSDRKRQIRNFAEWYNKFEGNMKTLHVSLIKILQYIHTIDSPARHPIPESELNGISLEQLTERIIALVDQKNIADQVDSECIKSYRMQMNAQPPIDDVSDDETEADECDSVITSNTNVVDVEDDTPCVADTLESVGVQCILPPSTKKVPTPGAIQMESDSDIPSGLFGVKNSVHYIEQLISEAHD